MIAFYQGGDAASRSVGMARMAELLNPLMEVMADVQPARGRGARRPPRVPQTYKKKHCQPPSRLTYSFESVVRWHLLPMQATSKVLCQQA